MIICLKKIFVNNNNEEAQTSDNCLCSFPTNHMTDPYFRNAFSKAVPEKSPQGLVLGLRMHG